MSNYTKKFLEYNFNRESGAEAEVTPNGLLVNDTWVNGKKNYKPLNQCQNIPASTLHDIKDAYKQITDKSAVMPADTSTPDIVLMANGDAVVTPEKGNSYRVNVHESENDLFDKILQKTDGVSLRVGGKRSKQINVNPHESKVEDNYDYDVETGTYTSKEKNKFGAASSFGEDMKIVDNFFKNMKESDNPFEDFEDVENEVADRIYDPEDDRNQDWFTDEEKAELAVQNSEQLKNTEEKSDSVEDDTEIVDITMPGDDEIIF